MEKRCWILERIFPIEEDVLPQVRQRYFGR
uniref:Uncharacterized protein n=1 Tax=Anguilla anguilla TaxID=7936 RepID=A0A0E9TKI2_ANGAN